MAWRPIKPNHWLMGILGLGLALLAPLVLWRGAHNLAYLGLLRQATSGAWTAWGLGLRAADVSGLAINADDLWRSDMVLGVDALPGGNLLAASDDCGDSRLLAQRRMRERNWEAARLLLDQATRACPAEPVAYLELGLVYDRLQLPAQAVAAFEKGGVGPWARELTAADYLLLAQDCGAPDAQTTAPACVSWLTRALELAPAHVFAVVRLARLKGWDASTIETMLQARAGQLTWSEPRLNELAVQGLLEWAEQYPKVRPKLEVWARQLALEHDYRGALELYRALQTYTPTHAWVDYYLGLTSGAVGEWAQAQTYLQRAVQQHPTDANVWAALGRAQAQLQLLDLATAAYRRALTLAPCLPEASIFLAQPMVECQAQLAVQFEAETLPTLGGQVQADESASGQQVMAGSSLVTYGPYQTLPPGQYQVTFRLKPRQALRAHCVRLEVAVDTNQTEGIWLTPLPVKYLQPAEAPAGRFTELSLAFQALGGAGFEYRVTDDCGLGVAVDWIKVSLVE